MTNAAKLLMRHAVLDGRSRAGAPIAAVAPASRWREALLAALVLMTVVATSARGDWLVLSSGETVETKGPWKLDGRAIVFTSTRGVLSSVRTTAVDIDSSRALTLKKQEEATKVVVAEPAPKLEPVLVLTDADFPTARVVVVQPADAAGAPADGGAAGAGAAAPATGEPTVVPASDGLETRIARQMPGAPSLQVVSWSARPTGEDQLSILGYVQNVGKLVSAAVAVTVTLFDTEGVEIAASEAALSSTALMPGVQAFFEAKFGGLPNFATLSFALSTVELEVGREEGEGEVQEGDPGAGTAGSAPQGGATAAGVRPRG